MHFFKRFFQFVKNLFNKKDVSQTNTYDLDNDENPDNPNEASEDGIHEKGFSLDEEFIFVERDNLIDNIKFLRTKLSILEFVCKDEYIEFNKKLDYLENLCYNEYNDYSDAVREGKLVFTCNPKFNDEIKRNIREVQFQIEDFIEKVGKYKVLQERIEKLTSELLTYYDDYKKGSFKGDFLELIKKAKTTLESLFKRVLGDEISQAVPSDFLDKKSLNDTYMYLLYLIEKCTIYYQVRNGCFDILYIRESFKEGFLLFLMKDLEEIRRSIKTFESTKYYDELMDKLEKIKSVNISSIDYVLKCDSFFEDFVNIEDDIIKINKKMASDNVKNKTQNLLNLLK